MFNKSLFLFIRFLSDDLSERRVLGSAIVVLIRQRKRALWFLGSLINYIPSSLNPKFFLWSHLSNAFRPKIINQFIDESTRDQLLDLIRETHAYRDAKLRLLRDRNGFMQRGLNYSQLRRVWQLSPPRRILIFHHYDPQGFLPRSWLEALLEIQSHDWQVLVSTSSLQSHFAARLQKSGVQIAFRVNLGFCLGGYRDLSLLFLSCPEVLQNLSSLVLLNDSNLLVQSPQVLIRFLQSWIASDERSSAPVLAGLTDSVERGCYHLQSFLLYANFALLNHPSWLRFWLQLGIDGSKDDLIDQGEIGLSRALIKDGVLLKPSYPLVAGLLQDPALADELHQYDIQHLQHVNQSLFAWRSLIARGYPFVKKHVLFKLIQHKDQPMTISQLASLLPSDRSELIIEDIHQLLMSRYSGNSLALH